MKWEILDENETNFQLDEEIELAKVAFIAAIKYQDIPFGGEVSLTFVGHDAMQEINNEHRKKNITTDVLSFPQYEKGELECFGKNDFVALGDIVLNIEKAWEQAAEFGHGKRREIAFLVVHSALHLLGFDHENEEKEREMFALQEKILHKMGLTRGDL